MSDSCRNHNTYIKHRSHMIGLYEDSSSTNASQRSTSSMREVQIIVNRHDLKIQWDLSDI